MPPPGLQLYLRPRVILTSDLLIFTVDRFMPLTHRPLVPIGIKIGSFVVKKFVEKFGERPNVRMNIMPPPVCLSWWTHKTLQRSRVVFVTDTVRTDSFLSRLSILTHDIDVAILSVSLSVRLSICPSVTFRYSMETA